MTMSQIRNRPLHSFKLTATLLLTLTCASCATNPSTITSSSNASATSTTQAHPGEQAFKKVFTNLIAQALIDHRLAGHRVPNDAGQSDFASSVCTSLAVQSPGLFALTPQERNAFVTSEFNEDKDWQAVGKLVSAWKPHLAQAGIIEKYLLEQYSQSALSPAGIAVSARYLTYRLNTLTGK